MKREYYFYSPTTKKYVIIQEKHFGTNLNIHTCRLVIVGISGELSTCLLDLVLLQIKFCI
jgi:hypothetical protein